jgi:histidinol dehydrogenase
MKANIRRLSTARPDFEAAFQRLQHWSAETDAAIETRVAEIIADVRARGDAALLELTARFDGVQAASMAALEIGPDELRAAMTAITPGAAWRPGGGCRARARLPPAPARRHVRAAGSTAMRDGTLLGQKVTPLDRVGIYVPGGKAAYPSSVLMNAIPAQVAGVGEIVMVVPTPSGASATPWCWPRPSWPACTGSSPSAARRPWPRWPMARPACRGWTRSPAPAMPTWPAPSGVSSARSAST